MSRTFFRYFALKEYVILDWKRQMADELRDAIDARPADEAPLDDASPLCVARRRTPPFDDSHHGRAGNNEDNH